MLSASFQLGIVKFPTLGMFRNGHYVQYDGDQDNQKEMLRWMTDEETLKIIGIIDEVSDTRTRILWL